AHGEHDIPAGWNRRVRGGVLFMQVDLACFNREFAASRHGIAGVDYEVHDDLFDLIRVCLNLAASSFRKNREFDVFADQPAEHLDHFFYAVVDVKNPRLNDLLSTKGKQLAGEAGGSLASLKDLVSAVAQRIVLPHMQ